MSSLQDRLQAVVGDAYRVEREFAAGGMSRLFLATDRTLGRQVVIKVLPPELVSDVSAARFRREIELAATLQHPHILGVLTAGIDADLVWYAMLFVQGESLRQRLERQGPLPVALAARLLREVADALAYAHDRGVIHRDVKPENVLLAADHALLADFGIAYALAASRGDERLTATGLALGTPAYMAPEQVAGGAVDGRADIYSLGMLGWEMLAGEVPFASADPRQLLAAQLTQPAPPLQQRRPETPPALAQAIARALEKDPARRFNSAAQFRDAIEVATTNAAARLHTNGRRTQRFRIVTAALVLAVVTAGVSVALSMRDGAQSVPSIGVLPFANRSDSASHEYFSDGIAEELISALGEVEALRVVARTSAFAFKGSNVDVHDIGKRLGVDMLVEGSVRRQNDSVRIDARLIRANDSFVLWSKSYDRPVRDVFATQADIAQQIANALRVELSATGDLGTQHRAADLVAHEAYLKGRFALGQGGRQGYEQALRYFAEAVARDSLLAEAHAGLAEAHAQLGNGGFVRHADAYPAARAAAQRALELNSNLADAHTALGYVRVSERDFPGAEASFKRALQLQPNYAAAHHLLGFMLVVLGRGDSGLRQLRIAKQLDPLSTRIGAAFARSLVYTKDAASAIAEFREMVNLEPRNPTLLFGLALAYEEAGQADSATAAVTRALDATPEHSGSLAVMAIVAAKRGNAAKAREILAALEKAPEGAAAFYIACIRAVLGDTEGALNWLERVYAEEPSWLISMQVEPWLASLRGQPRFESLQRRMGFSAA